MMVFALVLETVRWRGLRSSLAQNGGGVGAPSKNERLLPRAWRRVPLSRKSLVGQRCGPGQIYRWRRELGVGNGFAQVLIAPAGR